MDRAGSVARRRPARLAPVVVHRDDVRMLERRDGLGLRLEPLDERRRARDALVEDLDLDVAADPRLGRPEPDPGGRLAELLQEAVPPERFASEFEGTILRQDLLRADERGRPTGRSRVRRRGSGGREGTTPSASA